MALFEAYGLSVSLHREGEWHPLFADVNLFLEAGHIYDLVGASGSGKSTLLRTCARMISRSAGTLSIDRADSSSIEPTRWRKMVCLVQQKPAFVTGSVRDNLLLPWTLGVHAGEESPRDAELRSLMDAADLQSVELTRDVSQLSGGQAARIALLRVFVTKPKVMLLDEVDSALDETSAKDVDVMTRSFVGEDMACLRIRHRASDISITGTFVLDDGRVHYEEGHRQ